MSIDLNGTGHSHTGTQLEEASPQAARAFDEYQAHADKHAMDVLGPRMRALVALAVALAVGSNEARSHLDAARAAGASEGDIADTILATAGLQCGASIAYGRLAYKFVALGTGSGNGPQDTGIDVRGDRARMADLRRAAAEPFRGLVEFMETLHDESRMNLATKEYETIATAVGVAEHCVYCIDTHSNAMMNAGASNEELAAVLHLVSTVRARGVVREGIELLSSSARTAEVTDVGGSGEVAFASLELVFRPGRGR